MVRHRVPHLTVTQQRILRFIRDSIADQGEAPTVAELAEAVSLRPSSVHYQLRELEAKGSIVREPGQARGIRLA
jgi:repressor LexA